MPTIKDIGLWGPRIQKAYADMGILGFADTDLDALAARDEAIADGASTSGEDEIARHCAAPGATAEGRSERMGRARTQDEGSRARDRGRARDDPLLHPRGAAARAPAAWAQRRLVRRVVRRAHPLIKELQQKRYLPLRVIKAIVRGDVPASAHEMQALGALDGRLGPSGDAAQAAARERLSALAHRTGLAVREIKDLAAAEAIEIGTHDGDHWVEGPGVRLVELWARLRAAGFTSDRGFRAEQARLYVDMVRWLAREELREFTKGLAGRVDGDTLARMAEDGIQIGSEIIALLRRAALLRFVAQGNLEDVAPPDTAASRARGA